GERETVLSSREFLFFQRIGSACPNLCGGRVEPLMDVSKFGVGGNLSFATRFRRCVHRGLTKQAAIEVHKFPARKNQGGKSYEKICERPAGQSGTRRRECESRFQTH